MKVFITGASSGIGEALAVYYAAQGATLGLVARRADFLHGLNERLGGGHACYPLDVTDAPALHDAATDFMQRFGYLLSQMFYLKIYFFHQHHILLMHLFAN